MVKQLRFFCRIRIILCISLITALILTGCGKSNTDGSDYVFRYDLPDNPRTLDPQTAVDEHARLVISNLFEGLLRMNSSGDIIAGVAMEYEISDDLLTYTFYLREDIFWTNRSGYGCTVHNSADERLIYCTECGFYAQCTADDFVFAFRRLFNPDVKSRNAADYYCILNSKEVHEGDMPLDKVGVYAAGEFVLVIELEYPNSDFPILLTVPPAFPCNEEFYIQSSGRYGLITDAVPSNGGFYLRDWVYDPHWINENRLILRRNELNNNAEAVSPIGVNFYMDRGGHTYNFTSGKSDCIVMSGDGADDLIKKDYPYVLTENAVWGIVFNGGGVFADGEQELRLALAHSISTDADKILQTKQTGYRRATAIIPDGIKIGGEFFRDLVGAPKGLIADDDTISGYYNAVSRAAGAMTSTPVLIVPVTSGYEAVDSFIRTIAQQWQEKLSLFCRIEVLPSHEYEARLADGDYDIAVKKLTAKHNSPSSILDLLCVGDETATKLLQKARKAKNPEDIAQYYSQAENAVIQAAEFIPICFMTEYFFKNKKSEDLLYNSFTGAIVFRNGKVY